MRRKSAPCVREKITAGTYTTTWVVKDLLLVMRTLFLPGPEGVRVVLESARRIRVLPLVQVKFWAIAVPWST